MPKRPVERVRNGGQWTEARFWGFIRSALRSAFQKWSPKHEAKKSARIERGKYLCAACKGVFNNSEVEVDHRVPCGALKTYDDLPGFVERMFCEANGFQVLCRQCHQAKTAREKDERKK